MKNLFKNLRNPKILRILILVLVAILAIGGMLFFNAETGRVFIDDSLVSAPVSSISPTTTATLTQLDVYENETIKKGDAIAISGGQTLYAPTSGLVIMANNQLGSLVGPANPVVQLLDTSNMRIAGTIDENKGLDEIQVGQVASFTVDALPGQTFWGYVDEISPSAKSTQATFSISSERPTQQFVVYVRYNGAAYPAIKNGMSAKLTIYTNTK